MFWMLCRKTCLKCVSPIPQFLFSFIPLKACLKRFFQKWTFKALTNKGFKKAIWIAEVLIDFSGSKTNFQHVLLDVL